MLNDFLHFLARLTSTRAGFDSRARGAEMADSSPERKRATLVPIKDDEGVQMQNLGAGATGPRPSSVKVSSKGTVKLKHVLFVAAMMGLYYLHIFSGVIVYLEHGFEYYGANLPTSGVPYVQACPKSRNLTLSDANVCKSPAIQLSPQCQSWCSLADPIASSSDPNALCGNDIVLSSIYPGNIVCTEYELFELAHPSPNVPPACVVDTTFGASVQTQFNVSCQLRCDHIFICKAKGNAAFAENARLIAQVFLGILLFKELVKSVVFVFMFFIAHHRRAKYVAFFAHNVGMGLFLICAGERFFHFLHHIGEDAAGGLRMGAIDVFLHDILQLSYCSLYIAGTNGSYEAFEVVALLTSIGFCVFNVTNVVRYCLYGRLKPRASMVLDSKA